jgi:Phage protein
MVDYHYDQFDCIENIAPRHAVACRLTLTRRPSCSVPWGFPQVKIHRARPRTSLMDRYGHGFRDLTRLVGVTERSDRRWKVAGRIPQPYSTRVTLPPTAGLGVLSEEWAGRSIQRGELVSPEGHRLLPQHLRGLPLHLEALHVHRHARRRFANERYTAPS